MKRNLAILLVVCLVLSASCNRHKKTEKKKVKTASGNKYTVNNEKPKWIGHGDAVQAQMDKEKAEKEAKFEESIKDLTDQQKVDMYPQLFYFEHEINQDQLNNQTAANAEAEAKYKLNPNGGDEHKEIKDGPLSVMVTFQKSLDPDQKMQNVHMYLNDEAIYFLDNENSGYRGVMGSLQLNQVYDPQVDEVKMGQCCENVGIVNPIQYGDLNSKTTYYCFQVNDNSGQQDWRICSENQGIADEWRQAIILQTIIKGLREQGIYGLDALLKFQKQACKNPRGWSYQFQTRWPCLCPEGETQSPVDINTKSLTSQKVPMLNLRYAPTSSVVLNILPWETNVNGDYGQVIYKNRKRKRTTWNANEIRFKFPSEHKLDGKTYKAEIQVYHSNDNNRMAMSFFVSDDPADLDATKLVALANEKKDEKDELSSNLGANFFAGGAKDAKYKKMIQQNDMWLEQFSLLKWPQRAEKNFDTQMCIDTTVNITSILENDSVSNSWFMYMGSDTEPPCNEDVQWFVFKDPLIVNSLTLTSLKGKVLGSQETNARSAFPIMDRQVIYHEQCKKFELEVAEEVVVPNAQYVKAETTKHVYGIVHPKTKTMFDESSEPVSLTRGDNWKVDLNLMEEKELNATHPHIVSSLRGQLGQWLVENQGKIQAEERRIKLAQEKAAAEALQQKITQTQF